jgi:hypothetical protein
LEDFFVPQINAASISHLYFLDLERRRILGSAPFFDEVLYTPWRKWADVNSRTPAREWSGIPDDGELKYTTAHSKAATASRIVNWERPIDSKPAWEWTWSWHGAYII